MLRLREVISKPGPTEDSNIDVEMNRPPNQYRTPRRQKI